MVVPILFRQIALWTAMDLDLRVETLSLKTSCKGACNTSQLHLAASSLNKTRFPEYSTGVA